MAFDPVQPFVLLDDARRGGHAELFTCLRSTVVATDPPAVRSALAALRRATRDGLWAAGFMSFEAGFALEPRLASRYRPPTDGLPLLWFGLFEERRTIGPGEIDSWLSAPPATVRAMTPRVRQAEHEATIRRAQALIASGDIYQANITFPADVAFDGHPLGLYRRLRGAQAAPHGAVVHSGGAWVLSLSPELFFELRDGRLTARPMKGTAAREPQPEADRLTATALAHDPKNRAENLMIVDLLRNDLSRVAVAGTVKVEAAFHVETYPTVHQMTSTVHARLAPGHDAVDVLETLFPCGSVTGAPKIRAMEVIAELEAGPRGLYTGSIGYVGPDGDARFNVAIRTLVATGSGPATLGLGSGIVADSDPAAEWAECLTKGAFLTTGWRPFDLIETLCFDPSEGLIRLPGHMARLAASAAHLGFRFDRHLALNQLQATVGELTVPARIRLVLAPDGGMAVQAAPIPPRPAEPVEVALAPLPVARTDPRLYHKTTDRDFYDAARRAAGTYEVGFVNDRGELTEGSFTNLFVPRDGRLLTPPAHVGLLPGVLRAELLENGQAVEATLTPDDLAKGFFIGNSLRGLIRARLVRA